MNLWYQTLVKPAFTPSPSYFPIAWSILYILMGVAFVIILYKPPSKVRSYAINLFLIQISDIFGIWAVDFLMIYSSVLIFKILEDFIKISGSFSVKLKNSFLINRFSSCVFIFLLVFFYFYGII